MSDVIDDILQTRGPCLSSELAEALVAERGLTAATARKRISRHPNLKRLAYLPFPRNARFVYLQKDYGSPWFWKALSEALMANTLSHGGALAALLARGGLMPLRHFSIACGAPRAQKKHLSPATILERLQKANLLQVVDVPGVGDCVRLAQQTAPTTMEISGLQARLVTEEILLKAIRMWIKNLGLASYKSVVIRDERDEQPRVGTFEWDLTGPSYLTPMLDRWTAEAGKPKPGFIACDVLLGVEVTTLALRPFVTKCQTLRSLKGVGRCLQIFVATRYDKDAFRLAKEKGFVPATPETLFGEEVAAALADLTQLLASAAQTAVDPVKFDELFRRLGKIEGAATNLRGALFEYVAADLVRQTENCIEIRMNQVCTRTGTTVQRAEVDIVAVTHAGSIRFIECKGYKPGGTMPDEQVRKWLEERIPLLKAVARDHPDWRNRRLVFEFWTTGTLTAAAKALVAAAQASVRTTNYTIVLREREQIDELAKQCGDIPLRKTLAEHFLEHPFETIDRDIERLMDRQRRRLSEEPPLADVDWSDIVEKPALLALTRPDDQEG
jgi:hypothetical protein